MLLSAALSTWWSGIAVRHHPARLVLAAGDPPFEPPLPGIEIARSVAGLGDPEFARWVVGHRQPVDAVGAIELDTALTAGVPPAQIGVHCDDLTSNEMLWAASIGVGRLVISSTHQADVLSAVRGPKPVNVWLQSGSGCCVLRGRPSLRLVGLDAHRGDEDYADLVDHLIGEMADVRRESRVVVGRLGISGVHVNSDTVYEIDDAVTDGCIRYRVPRPQLLLSGSLVTA
ncbi:hypothetical protein [Mycolicibacterium sp. CBMA 226]|uniref:hypothetical protein n=1 Tax=Mycolicibacterium sp. CBMA 226 TaxID=2606611 RepID=UPI0012DED4BE|nr:hypothetical protein [Mycolicibacterium sp. CBMA 226]MUL77957.1 hypothetical protein [Mycolicibacterium sp. CBMA 226]